MLTRWFVVEVPVRSSDTCITVGNCKTKKLADDVVAELELQSDSIFRVVGPITQNMLEGKLNPEDIELVEATMEHLEHQQAGGQTH